VGKEVLQAVGFQQGIHFVLAGPDPLGTQVNIMTIAHVLGVYAATYAVPRFQQEHRPAGLLQGKGGRKPGVACAYNDHIVFHTCGLFTFGAMNVEKFNEPPTGARSQCVTFVKMQKTWR
jgi:hypothetical protein